MAEFTTPRTAAPVLRPRTAARIALSTLFAANGAVVTALFAASGPSSNVLVSLGRLTGLYGALLMAFQLLLIARLPWVDRRLGMDRLTAWHRLLGFGLVWTLTGHAVFIVSGYAAVENTGPIDQLGTLITTMEDVLRAVVALVLILVVGGLSARYARRRLAYETWHFAHLYTYLAVVLAFGHQVAVGETFVDSEPARAYWWTLWGVALAAVVAGRVVLPVQRNLKHRFRVSAVVPESPDVVSVYVTGEKLDELPVRAGQFFLWRFLSRDRWWQANPFSLSAAPDGRSLRLTVKAVGQGSAGLRGLRPGTRVFAEGPYGAFTTAHQTRDNALLIAGVVGITPIRALLEDVTGHVVLLCRVRSEDDAVLLDELVAIARTRGAVLRLLTGPSDQDGPNGPVLGPRNLAALVPDVADRDVFVCGPPGMTRAAVRGLKELGLPAAQVHAERFSLAG